MQAALDEVFPRGDELLHLLGEHGVIVLGAFLVAHQRGHRGEGSVLKSVDGVPDVRRLGGRSRFRRCSRFDRRGGLILRVCSQHGRQTGAHGRRQQQRKQFLYSFRVFHDDTSLSVRRRHLTEYNA